MPYYKDADGALQPAPLLGKVREEGGFEVPKPRDFVKNNPRAVMLAMWAVKFSIKVALHTYVPTHMHALFYGRVYTCVQYIHLHLYPSSHTYTHPHTHTHPHPHLHPLQSMHGMWITVYSWKQVAAAQLSVTVPAETLNALSSVTDDLLMAVLSQSITYMHDAADGDEREAALVEELDEKLDTHYSEMPDDAIDKMVGNEKFVEMR